MKGTGTCPKCKSRSIATGPGGTHYANLAPDKSSSAALPRPGADIGDRRALLEGAVREYQTFVCADCGYYERYMDARVVQAALDEGTLQLIGPPPAGPYR